MNNSDQSSTHQSYIYNVLYFLAACICVPLLAYFTIGILLCLALPSAMFGKRVDKIDPNHKYGHKPDDTYLVH